MVSGRARHRECRQQRYAINEVVRRERGRPVSTAVLAAEFEVSRRTIERDVASLRNAGVPLYGEPGRNGGVVSLEADGGVVVSLSTAEVTALLVAVAGAGVDMPYSGDAATATARLLDGLAESTRQGVDKLRQKVRSPKQAGVVPARVRRTVEEGVRREVVINIGYVDGAGNRTDRSVEPVGFFFGGDYWHLIGWCHLRDDRRLFRLDRIRSARLTRRPASERDVDDVLGWVPVETSVP